eukprot:scaffold7855_cov444-Prasinococcus_capsulatus_cf.AAC.3
MARRRLRSLLHFYNRVGTFRQSSSCRYVCCLALLHAKFLAFPGLRENIVNDIELLVPSPRFDSVTVLVDNAPVSSLGQFVGSISYANSSTI